MAKTTLERDSWMIGFNKVIEEAKAAAEGIKSSEGYKETMEKLSKFFSSSRLARFSRAWPMRTRIRRSLNFGTPALTTHYRQAILRHGRNRLYFGRCGHHRGHHQRCRSQEEHRGRRRRHPRLLFQQLLV